MNIIERIYKYSEDLEWKTGIPPATLLAAISIAISTLAIIIALVSA